MYRPRVIRNVNAFALIFLSCAVLAETREEPLGWVEVGSTMVASASSTGEQETAGLVTFDVAASIPVHSGQFSLLIEAETSPGYLTDSPEPSAPRHDLGAAFGASQGEVRIAEFHYDFASREGLWSIGFIDSKAYIDGSVIANDDKTQFSNPAFVNNPTIRLPDNNLGMAWQRPAESGNPGYSVLLATNNGPGAFIALETLWAFEALTARLGAWGNNPGLFSEETSLRDYGLYSAVDGRLAALNWNLRVGLPIPERRLSGAFISIAAEIPVAGNSIGIAVGHQKSGDSHIEAYFRHAVADSIVITPCIQFNHRGETGEAAGGLMAGVRLRLII